MYPSIKSDMKRERRRKLGCSHSLSRSRYSQVLAVSQKDTPGRINKVLKRDPTGMLWSRPERHIQKALYAPS